MEKEYLLQRSFNCRIEPLERELYEYAGYFYLNDAYHRETGKKVYIKAEDRPYGYTDKTGPVPSTISLTKGPDMETAIVFDTAAKTITANKCPLDMEFIRILTALGRQYGIAEEERPDVLRHKLYGMAEGKRQEHLSKEELELLIKMTGKGY